MQFPIDRRCTIVGLLLSGFPLLLAAPAAGVDGQWEAFTAIGRSSVLLELKSDGARLTGWLSQPNGKLEIANGSIQGNAVSFEMAVSIQGQQLRLFYEGQLDGDELRLTLRVRGRTGEESVILKRVDPDASPVDRFSEETAPEEVAAWLKANAIRFASVDADAGFADMAPLKARLRDARIVAMGEATHGTREFQQLKVRMFRFLVEQLGFTVFGIEANWPESLSVNEYVLGGNVDPTPGLGFLWWQTEEVFALLRWMRQYNQDPAHTQKLKFYGFDMQTPGLAESNVLDYLQRVDPELVDPAGEAFDLLGRWGENKRYETASAEVKRRTTESLASILRRFDEHKQAYVAASSLQDWTMARQNMVVVKQAEVKLGNQGEPGRTFRDRAMAENVKWILEQEPPGTKMMLWAHNGHVGAAAPVHNPDRLPMGGYLRGFFGDRLVACGFMFQKGGFRAVDMTTRNVSEFTVGPPPRGSLDATLAAVSSPLFAVDLRGLQKGKVADWFAEPHVSRQIGGGYSQATPGVWMHRIRAARDFDLLIFVDETTASK
jgi:erythromycin esterase